MNMIRFRCAGCDRLYELGRNAAVVTMSGMLKDFRGVNILDSRTSFFDNKNAPDLVSPLERGFDVMDESIKTEQLAEISEISSKLQGGQCRFWRCSECEKVQRYKLVP